MGLANREKFRLRFHRIVWWGAAASVWITTAVVVLFGFICVLLSIAAFIDPAGAKMSDDADPFGPPPTVMEIGIGLLFSFGIVLVGALLPVGFYRFVERPGEGAEESS